MNNQEKELFLRLCNFMGDPLDEKLLEYATPSVLGHLFYNRMQAIAYGVLKSNHLLGKVNREFRNSLKAAYNQNVVKNQSFLSCVEWLENLLSQCDCQYAMLKGALLCERYPEGYRTSNDIDLLVRPEDVTKLGNLLLQKGFQQGYVRNDEFVPATRKEIIASKMMRGETVPYIKEMDLPGMRWLEVDINFSLDYKNGKEDVLNSLLNETRVYSNEGYTLTTLSKNDFFLHLCCHLYKEATTLPWVIMKRDMALYKYGDIYMLLEEMSYEDVGGLYKRAYELGMEKICAFAIAQTSELFVLKNTDAVLISKAILEDDPEFIHMVIDPSNKRELRFVERSIKERFFCESRESLFAEVEK